MKKTLFALILFAAVVAFSGCGSRNQGHDEVHSVDTDYIILQDFAYTIQPIEDTYPSIDTDCIFLQDFDYMVQLMEDTFPFFGVAERRHGVDLRELLRESREFIAGYPYSFVAIVDPTYIDMLYEYGFKLDLDNLPELNAHLFWGLLSASFFTRAASEMEDIPIGHLRVLCAEEFDLDRRRYPLSIVRDHANRAFNASNAIMFYDDERFRYYFSEAAFDGDNYHYLIIHWLVSMHFAPGFAEETCEICHNMVATRKFPETAPIHHSSTISYAILEEGRIAYLRIPSFMTDPGRAIAEPFYLTFFNETIQYYDHLIIDIRGNGGGFSQIWYRGIMYTLWPDMENVPDMPLYAFYIDSELGRTLWDANVSLPCSNNFFILEADYLHARYLPYFNEEDMPLLTQGRRITTNMGAHLGNVLIPNTPFAGEIWLLTCSSNYSAAEMFAWHAKHMNFATLVGETTGGAHTHGRMWFALPNTGIVVNWDVDYLTDAYGRSLEEFPTTPHYFNREGLCAFETVMEMISEMN